MATTTTSNAASDFARQSDAVKPALRKPVFTKVDRLKPVTSGHTLTVNVLSADPVLQKGSVSQHLRQTRISEYLVGDETGTIVFTERNDQVDLMKPDSTVILRNAKIDMFQKFNATSSCLTVDKEDNNLSLVDYEFVNVVEEYVKRRIVLSALTSRDSRRILKL